jgi:DNA polymerase-3 subunit delta
MPPRKSSSRNAAGRVAGPVAPGEPLARILHSGVAPTTFLLLGGDSYLREQARRQIVEHFVPEAAREWAVRRFSAREAGVSEVLRHAESLPMLAPRQIFIIQDVEAWQKSSGTEADEESGSSRGRAALSAENDPAAEWAKYFENPAPFTVLLFEAAALDQRMRLARLLNERAQLVPTEIASGRDPEERRSAAVDACLAWIPKLARELGVTIDPDAATTLAEAANGDLTLVRNELQKLALYVAERGAITSQDVETLVASARHYSIWQFAVILAHGDRRRALLFLDSLLGAGEQPPAIVGALAWMYRKLLEVQELPAGVQSWQVTRELGMRPETAALAQREAQRVPRETLRRGLVALYEADNRLKSGSADDRMILEMLVTRLTAGR